MGVPFANIEELIEVCKKVDEKVYEDDWDKRIHVRDIGATLQKLIDDELAELEEMSQRFQESHQDSIFEEDDVAEEYAKVRCSIRKADWPHGV